MKMYETKDANIIFVSIDALLNVSLGWVNKNEYEK